LACNRDKAGCEFDRNNKGKRAAPAKEHRAMRAGGAIDFERGTMNVIRPTSNAREAIGAGSGCRRFLLPLRQERYSLLDRKLRVAEKEQKKGRETRPLYAFEVSMKSAWLL
jgi:hypothetical protein